MLERIRRNQPPKSERVRRERVRRAEFSMVNPQPEPEIFTKLSRIKWTPEHRQQLREMWERGDRASAIAARLGCRPSAISVARARFGLTPRREVAGRPKRAPDEPAHKIERVAFTTSRLMEFCTEKELVAQTGHESEDWPRVVIKELTDNSINACEETEIVPVIGVTIKRGEEAPRLKLARIIIEDNGPGIAPSIISKITDYTVRCSSREAYISPTRGRQGNALKTILAMGYVLGGKIKGETWIEARGVKHRILFTVDQIRQQPIVKNIRSRSRIRTGTRITVFWPGEINHDEIRRLLFAFSWMNPHLSLRFTIDGETVIDAVATNVNWKKYRACDATSAHWYSLEQIERYAGALITRDQEQKRKTRQKFTVREFIAQFRGMSATDKQKQVLRELGASHLSLQRFFGSEDQANHRRMEKLKLLREHTRPVRPELLGVIGEEHFRRLMTDLGGEPKSFKYGVDAKFDASGLPYVVESAICPFADWVAGKRSSRTRILITGVNFSATLQNPFDTFRGLEGMSEILVDLRAGPYNPVIVAVHYTCPHIEYLDRGKSRIGLE